MYNIPFFLTEKSNTFLKSVENQGNNVVETPNQEQKVATVIEVKIEFNDNLVTYKYANFSLFE